MSWLKQAVGFATTSFILMVIFIVISEPYVLLLDTVEDESGDIIENGDYTTENIVPVLSMLRNIFGVLFVLSFFSLLVGIFLKAHEEEYEEYPERYNRRL